MRRVIVLVMLVAAIPGCRQPEPSRPAAGQAEGQPAVPPPAPQTGGSPADQGSSGPDPATTASGPRRDQAPPHIAGPTTPLPGSGGAPAAPRFREVTLPAGTELALTLETAVASDASRVEDAVRATLRRPIAVDGVPVVPRGTVVRGSVVDVVRSGKVKGRARVSLRFTGLVLDDELVELRTSALTREARATKKKDVAKVGVPAAGGAVLGALLGGGKGAAIGATVGGGAGAAMVMTTRGEEVRLGPGAPISVRLSEPVTVRVPE